MHQICHHATDVNGVRVTACGKRNPVFSSETWKFVTCSDCLAAHIRPHWFAFLMFLILLPLVGTVTLLVLVGLK